MALSTEKIKSLMSKQNKLRREWKSGKITSEEHLSKLGELMMELDIIREPDRPVTFALKAQLEKENAEEALLKASKLVFEYKNLSFNWLGGFIDRKEFAKGLWELMNESEGFLDEFVIKSRGKE